MSLSFQTTTNSMGKRPSCAWYTHLDPLNELLQLMLLTSCHTGQLTPLLLRIPHLQGQPPPDSRPQLPNPKPLGSLRRLPEVVRRLVEAVVGLVVLVARGLVVLRPRGSAVSDESHCDVQIG